MDVPLPLRGSPSIYVCNMTTGSLDICLDLLYEVSLSLSLSLKQTSAFKA